jgi:two-component system OmpR family sensor kinase
MGIVEVTDSGPGMTTEDATNAFERLYRGSQAPTVHGSGVGLSIVRALTTAQNGTVELTSTLGAGTTVRVALPLVRTPE